jgi:Polyketide cyclase / dehydrase and lipid transport
VLGGGPVRLGSQLRQHRRRGQREFDLTFTVTEHEPPRRHTVEGTVFGVRTTMAFDIEPRQVGSRVTMTATVDGRGPRRLLAPIVTREMRKSTVAALAALRAHLQLVGVADPAQLRFAPGAHHSVPTRTSDLIARRSSIAA